MTLNISHQHCVTIIQFRNEPNIFKYYGSEIVQHSVNINAARIKSWFSKLTQHYIASCFFNECCSALIITWWGAIQWASRRWHCWARERSTVDNDGASQKWIPLMKPWGHQNRSSLASLYEQDIAQTLTLQQSPVKQADSQRFEMIPDNIASDYTCCW